MGNELLYEVCGWQTPESRIEGQGDYIVDAELQNQFGAFFRSCQSSSVRWQSVMTLVRVGKEGHDDGIAGCSAAPDRLDGWIKLWWPR